MKNVLSIVTAVLMVAMVLAFGAKTVLAQDPVKVAPNNYKVLLENDRVRVLEAHLKPGEKVAMHSHPPHVLYFISGGKGKFTSPDGKVAEREFPTGGTAWSEADTHSPENVGTTDIRVLVMEMKEPPKMEKETKK